MMASRKKCFSCGNEAPIAQKVCNCGVSFVKGKKCYNCGIIISIINKACDCNNSFKQRRKSGFQELPVVLTDDRLRPTRSIRTKQTVLDDNDYFYNLKKQKRISGTHSSDGNFEKLSDHNKFCNKELNDIEMESVAHSDSSKLNTMKAIVKNRVEKMYPKRKRQKSTKYQDYESLMDNNATSMFGNKMDKKTAKKLIFDSKKTSLYAMKDKNLRKENECKKLSARKKLIDSNSELGIKGNKDTETKNDSEKRHTKSSLKQSVNLDSDISDDEKPLKELKTKISHSLIVGKSSMINPVKKKLGRPRIHPILPKKPVGRPRKYPANLSHEYHKKHTEPARRIIEKAEILAINENPTDHLTEMENALTNSYEKKGIKRGRPKGCKDSKPRKVRNDYIVQLNKHKIYDDDMSKKITKQKQKNSKCLLSPPSLIFSKEEKHIDNESLNPEEIEKIERRLDKTNPFIIPEYKKDLYSSILSEINRRISSQSFQSSLLEGNVILEKN